MDIDAEIEIIEQLLDKVRPTEAEAHLSALIEDLGADVVTYEDELREAAQLHGFLKKRRRRLLQLLETAVVGESGAGPSELVISSSAPQKPAHRADGSQISLQGYSAELATLSSQYLFKWSTHYATAFERQWSALLAGALSTNEMKNFLEQVRDMTAYHSTEIFEKGFKYKRRHDALRFEEALDTAMNGLQRFLEVPVIPYIESVNEQNVVQETRSLISAMISGILVGFMRIDFDGTLGSELLADRDTSWLDFLGLLTQGDLSIVRSEISESWLRDAMTGPLDVLARGIDSLALGEGSILPTSAYYDQRARTIQIYLRLPADSAEQVSNHSMIGVLDRSGPTRREIRAWAEPTTIVVVGRVRIELTHLMDDEVVRKWVDPAILGDVQAGAEQVVARFDEALQSQDPLTLGDDRQLVINVAERFPIDNPELGRRFFVERRSVRGLIRDFRGRNGIRLWCSLRRSGKTTACFDLPSITATSSVIAQTCDTSSPFAESTRLFVAIRAALDQGKIDPDLVENIVADLDGSEEGADGRKILLIDEYETLFETLDYEARVNRSRSYSVVNGALSQLRKFSTSNLLVFVGQRPDAHFIQMDHNPISPYVKQDQFPLFDNTGPNSSSEFAILLNRVFAGTFDIGEGFVDAVWVETGGHPWLTVKVLVHFTDWLMSEGRAFTSSHLDAGLFAEFQTKELNPAQLVWRSDYKFFAEASRDALSESGRERTPWLHFAYRLLDWSFTRDLDTTHRDDAIEFLRDEGIHKSGIFPADLVRGACLANFLQMDEKYNLKPRIPLLARVSQAFGVS